MNKFVVSLLVSVALMGTLLAGFVLVQRPRQSCPSCERMAQDLSSVQEELRSLREDTGTLVQEVRNLGAAGSTLAAASPVAAPAGDAAAVRQGPATRPEEIKAYVLSALEDDRKLRDDERKQQREDARQRLEARRQEAAVMKTGPYEGLNLKVNSLAKVLALNEAQKQSYYALAKQARDRLQAERKAAETERSQGERPRPQNQDRGRKLQETVQKDFDQGVRSILSASQVETYNQLSRSARDFGSLGQVSAPGEETREFPGGDGFAAGPRRRGPGR